MGEGGRYQNNSKFPARNIHNFENSKKIKKLFLFFLLLLFIEKIEFSARNIHVIFAQPSARPIIFLCVRCVYGNGWYVWEWKKYVETEMEHGIGAKNTIVGNIIIVIMIAFGLFACVLCAFAFANAHKTEGGDASYSSLVWSFGPILWVWSLNFVSFYYCYFSTTAQLCLNAVGLISSYGW